MELLDAVFSWLEYATNPFVSIVIACLLYPMAEGHDDDVNSYFHVSIIFHDLIRRSPAIMVNDRQLWLAGLVGLDPETGDLVSDDVADQTRQALTNMGSVLEHAGASYKNVVKTSVFLTDINDFQAMNEVYKTFFPENPPARSAYQVVALPKSRGDECRMSSFVRKVVRPPTKVSAIGHYRTPWFSRCSRPATGGRTRRRGEFLLSGVDHFPRFDIRRSPAIMVNDRQLWLAGLVGLDPETGDLVSDDVADQTRQALTNMGSVLEHAGASYKNVVKTSVFLTDINDFQAMNEVYKTFFPENPPARSAYQVVALPKNARVEIEAVAIAGEVLDVPVIKQ
ncbi:unnamed protein product [Darwinula stevensoni]|uniref:Uncharacterized protein n=1 Tax=Darwinula stevensoni TaxID=69355 RepID=A0A7R9A345_9CRUS|nr:unnamed protein product [Darwinula stevensoni]CAG0889978.1 unnamed protein product [Darwinula stevensoni]